MSDVDVVRKPHMTVVERRIEAPIEQVFEAMTDGWLLPVWVVGATHMRDVDSAWPAPGAKVHHQVGAWPFALSDDTEVLEYERPSRFVLQAAAWPFGEARISFRLRPDGPGATHVEMEEGAVRGPGRWLDNPVQRRVLVARNHETLDRLASIAENRNR